MQARREFLTIGGNRYPDASDWGPAGLAFGAHHSIAIWRKGEVLDYLQGHDADVTAVRYFSFSGLQDLFLISGSLNGRLIVWKRSHSREQWELALGLPVAGEGSIHAIAVGRPGTGVVFVAGADGKIHCIKLGFQAAGRGLYGSVQWSISLKPKYVPLAVAAAHLPGRNGSYLLAVGGTKTAVQLFLVEACADGTSPRVVASLTGHEGWIRSLAFTTGDTEDILILASASQDRYIRLWCIRPVVSPGGGAGGVDKSNSAEQLLLLDNTLTFQDDGARSLSVKLDALLVGHEDWIYTVQWEPAQSWPKKLLSASADNSLSIWVVDQTSGIWITTERLGEISQQKGSTTATGSTGGFWQGLWSPDGNAVISLGRTGSWRLWQNTPSESDDWIQEAAPTGHTRSVTGLAWSNSGGYLLSTSADQTTRLWAKSTDARHLGWAEFSRSQIHGYDLNCVDTLDDTRFVSGADEKPMRVFEEPGAVAEQLQRWCGLESTGDLPLETASMPVLGLSNKMVEADEERPNYDEGSKASEARQNGTHASHLPLEDDLSRRTLWPEIEKLYGHGYEISAVACSHDGQLIASACKASSIDHAVIRIFRTKNWLEVKPALKAHSLTVTALRFSDDSLYLLSGGRDRQCVIWSRSDTDLDSYEVLQAIPKAHTKMILGVTWAPSHMSYSMFATAGRDGRVRIWTRTLDPASANNTWSNNQSVGVIADANVAITAIDFCNIRFEAESVLLAYGTEGGKVKVASISMQQEMVKIGECASVMSEDGVCAAASIRQIRWRTGALKGSEPPQMAVASDDSSVQIFAIATVPLR